MYTANDFEAEVKLSINLRVVPSDKNRDQEISIIFNRFRNKEFSVFVVKIIPKVAKGIGSIFKVSIEIKGEIRQRPVFQYFKTFSKFVNLELSQMGLYCESVSNTKHEIENIYSMDFVVYFIH